MQQGGSIPVSSEALKVSRTQKLLHWSLAGLELSNNLANDCKHGNASVVDLLEDWAFWGKCAARGGQYSEYVVVSKLGVPSWGPYAKGIILFGGLYSGSLIFVNPPMLVTH